MLVVALASCKVDQETARLAGLLPTEVAGWRQTGRDRVYGPDNLYDYVDGGAELYRSYGFRGMFGRTYSRDNQPEIVVDIFDMDSSANAFGVFTHSRESVSAAFGQGSQHDPGYLLFWRDRYLVSILASPETERSRPVLPALATAIAQSIGHDGPLPAILDRLPPEDLVEASIRYFHHYIWQNAHYFIADANILNIGPGTEALLAKYGAADDRRLLLLVSYPSVTAAEAGRDGFTRNFLPEGPAGPAAQIEDGSWVGSQAFGSLLAVVFAPKSEDQVLALLSSVAEQVEHNFNPGATGREE